ncbi:MAG: hypothetical protein HRJ53_07475 [Acidobacteria bacterium Pan2503]|uniref:Uncharacterized protein n=1 Tax=Candidatus Acidiferrum panamense TaxID=2741543 RepID=A0A7V8NNW1_9BACT|nr:hypothetical protein [Candidatus Acidoferrum panamensis]
MTFLVSVRWHPPEQQTPCTSAWLCSYVAGDIFNLTLKDASGIVVMIPLELIEYVQMERKG